MMTFLNLTTAIYWGQLSNCDAALDGKVPQYSCIDTTAYGAVAAFASLLFILQLLFTVGLVLYRGEMISENGLYDGVTTHEQPSFGYSAPTTSSSSFTKLPPSADL